MILIINTAPQDHMTVILAQKKDSFKAKTISGQFRQAEKLLPTIDAICKKQGVDFNKLRGLGVVVGPGGFTSVRIGVAVANAFAYSLSLPIIGLKLSDFSDDKDLVAKVFEKIKAVKPAKLVLPFYDREPNITMPKN